MDYQEKMKEALSCYFFAKRLKTEKVIIKGKERIKIQIGAVKDYITLWVNIFTKDDGLFCEFTDRGMALDGMYEFEGMPIRDYIKKQYGKTLPESKELEFKAYFNDIAKGKNLFLIKYIASVVYTTSLFQSYRKQIKASKSKQQD